MVLRICSAYTTVSYEALIVIAGTIPLYLLGEERKINYDKRNRENVRVEKQGNTPLTNGNRSEEQPIRQNGREDY